MPPQFATIPLEHPSFARVVIAKIQRPTGLKILRNENCADHDARPRRERCGVYRREKTRVGLFGVFPIGARSIMRDSHVAASRLCKFALWLPY